MKSVYCTPFATMITIHSDAETPDFDQIYKGHEEAYVHGFYWGADGYIWGMDFQHVDFKHKHGNMILKTLVPV